MHQQPIPSSYSPAVVEAISATLAEQRPATQTPQLDLSAEGVDRILAALAEAGLTVHYNETDGDHYIDIHLRPVDTDTTLISLSWRRDRRGWYLAESDAAGVELCTWPLGHDLEDVVSDAARLLAQNERVETEMADEMVTAAGLTATAKPVGCGCPSNDEGCSVCNGYEVAQLRAQAGGAA